MITEEAFESYSNGYDSDDVEHETLNNESNIINNENENCEENNLSEIDMEEDEDESNHISFDTNDKREYK
jgi:hypothetical protein